MNTKEALQIGKQKEWDYRDLLKKIQSLLIAHVKDPKTEYYDEEGTVTKGQPGVYPIGHGENITVPWQQEQYKKDLPKLRELHENVYH